MSSQFEVVLVDFLEFRHRFGEKRKIYQHYKVI